VRMKKYLAGAIAILVAGAVSAPAGQTQSSATQKPVPTSRQPQPQPTGQPARGNNPAPPTTAPVPGGVALPPGYVIGPDDLLGVLFWRDKDMSGDVAVRPDGKISLPLLNEIDAAGLTPEQLREKLTTAASKFLEEPNVTVVVKQINSRKVHITGAVAKPGAYPLTAPTTVLQLISMAGGLSEFAKAKEIMVVRVENGRQIAFKFNYKEVAAGKNLKQNIELKPGDSVIVP
jgi:polysaccharide biosynthesis/export protein